MCHLHGKFVVHIIEVRITEDLLYFVT